MKEFLCGSLINRMPFFFAWWKGFAFGNFLVVSSKATFCFE